MSLAPLDSESISKKNTLVGMYGFARHQGGKCTHGRLARASGGQGWFQHHAVIANAKRPVGMCE